MLLWRTEASFTMGASSNGRRGLFKDEAPDVCETGLKTVSLTHQAAHCALSKPMRCVAINISGRQQRISFAREAVKRTISRLL